MAAAREAVQERVLHLGSEGHLVAIAADPATAICTPTVIFLNAGVLHRVGPHRLHVLLSRRLAAAGTPAVRMDLSGIGDSRPLPSESSFRASSVADTRAAMDQLGAAGQPARFVLFGLCSGADNALATASADPRVVGLVLVDPPAYVTSQAIWRRRRASLRDPAWLFSLPRRSIQALLRRASRAWTSLTASAATPEPAPGRQAPPLPSHQRELTALVDRGVRILAIYSGVLGDRYNASGQFDEFAPTLRGRVDVAWFPAANHTFTERAAQAELLATVLRWFDRQFRAP
jgi:pimeloyl-ACP methyl ester carboxylesterase